WEPGSTRSLEMTRRLISRWIFFSHKGTKPRRMISLFPSKSTGYRLSFSAERRRVYRGRFPS
ncbi:MAG: hypothetical protein, partial [Olavius algarvensis Gamma 1 endosymbiont]